MPTIRKHKLSRFNNSVFIVLTIYLIDECDGNIFNKINYTFIMGCADILNEAKLFLLGRLRHSNFVLPKIK